MSTLKRLTVFALLIALLTTCETELDIIAPRRDVTVIYGLLEVNKSRHYIRINRAFVGEESATDMASKAGVNEYSESELKAEIVEKNVDGTPTGNTWDLIPTYINTKQGGTFFSDSNKVYYFDATLNPKKIYQLRCFVNVPGEPQKEVTAETAVLGNIREDGALVDVSLMKPNLVGASSDPSQADRSEVDFIANGDYRLSTEVDWQRASGGVAYTAYLRFYYREVNPTANTRTKDSITIFIGTRRVDKPESEGVVTFTHNPQEFFEKVAETVEDYDFGNENFNRVASDTLQYFLEIADHNLATYMEVNQPITEVVQEQPEYTNISNGIGLFASRYIASTIRTGAERYQSGRVFKAPTLEELLYSNQVNPDKSFNTSTKGFIRPGRCNDETKSCR